MKFWHQFGKALLLVSISIFCIDFSTAIEGQNSKKTELKRKDLSVEEFSNIFVLNQDKIQDQIILREIANKSKFDASRVRTKWFLCSSELAFNITDKIFINNKKSLPLDKVVQSLKNIDAKEVLSKECQLLVGNYVDTVIANTIVTLEDSQKTSLATSEIDKQTQKAERSLTEKRKLTLNVLGLFPDDSEESELSKISNNKKDYCLLFCLNIGGYDLQCDAEFEFGDKLSMLTCWFGKNGDENNLEIFKVLEAGFTKKFGKATEKKNYQKETLTNAKVNISSSRWIDKFGNTLVLNSSSNRMNEGTFTLTSSLKLIKEKVKTMNRTDSTNF